MLRREIIVPIEFYMLDIIKFTTLIINFNTINPCIKVTLKCINDMEGNNGTNIIINARYQILIYVGWK